MNRKFLVGLSLLLGACSGDAAPPRTDDSARVAADTASSRTDDSARVAPDKAAPPAAVQLVDTTLAPAVAGEAGWNYHKSAEADLDGDGQPESIVLTARVELYRGRPAWDDGQPWQVYIEEPDGRRTYVFAQRLQLGTLTMRVTSGAEGQRPTVVLLEHLPDRLSVYEVSYEGPGRVSIGTEFQRTVDPRGETASPQLP